MAIDNELDPGQYTGNPTPWWQGPAPAGYTGAWPPPLKPGQSYGSIPGQILDASGSTTTVDQLEKDNYAPSSYGNTPATPTGGTGGGSGGGPVGGGLLAPFGESFQAPGMLNLGGPDGLSYIPPTPNYAFPGMAEPPAFPTVPKFQAPSADEMLRDPGYQFRRNQGRDMLQSWAAAKGTLNDSETANALEDYGQNVASQEYGNVWNRDWNVYRDDVQNNYLQPYEARYRGWSDAVLGPTMATFGANVGAGNLGYSTQAAGGQHQNDMNQMNAWNQFLQKWNQFRDQRDSTFDKVFQYANA